MLVPLSNSRARSAWLATTIFLIALAAAATAYFLQKGEVGFTAGAAAFLGGLIATAQWLIAQLRESAKISWEAVKTYYTEGDSKELIAARDAVFNGPPGTEHIFCNFYEKWGRLVEMGYLPIELFNGPSGTSIANALVKLTPFIETRRQSNPRYAQFYIWLVKRIHEKGYLVGTNAQGQLHAVFKQFGAA
ncbi:MAG: hypothetical protein KF720_07865 [Rubrivivax sp.]|nr:hypothetical protein [Rubrivivax sp.]